ncbi:MAG: 4-hydroxy-tetrahydrodipicolinate synthase [Alphaproteobacteria bacterium]|nr:4-hydroxy-tetrahydrodipicolinate synthase [Alphaproteobacteria bacterium]MBV8407429.1 4-hydroxy-tetrahydrodipicolinate synthase [Alphaproteobacteria bacterium]
MSSFALRHGSIASLPTPYRQGRVDLAAIEGLCHRLIRRGVVALSPCGTTGEGSLLTPEEHRQVVTTTVTAAAGRVPVIAGASSNNTQVALELARAAESAGANAILAVTPSYLRPGQAGIIAHFCAIHDAVGIPVILSDVPARTGCALEDASVKELVKRPRIVGLKDATADIPRVSRLRRRLGPEFLLLSADDATQAAFRVAGGDGCISVAANVAPALCAALHHACDDGMAGDIQWYDQLLAPLYEALALEANPVPVKRALSRMGLISDGLRLPLTPLGPDADRELGQALDATAPVEEKEALRFAAMHASNVHSINKTQAA